MALVDGQQAVVGKVRAAALMSDAAVGAWGLCSRSSGWRAPESPGRLQSAPAQAARSLTVATVKLSKAAPDRLPIASGIKVGAAVRGRLLVALRSEIPSRFRTGFGKPCYHDLSH